MAKKKSAAASSAKDQHVHKILTVRMPDDLADAMRTLAAKNYRPLNMEMRLAVERHLEAAGMWPPKGAE